MIYDITPVPAPRMTRADSWKKRPCVLRYFDFKDRARELGIEVENGAKIVFVLPMPKSWNKKKKNKMDGVLHRQRPDLDNLLKALLDAVHEEDCGICFLEGISKYWGKKGTISIT